MSVIALGAAVVAFMLSLIALNESDRRKIL